MKTIQILDDEPGKRERFRDSILSAGISDGYDIRFISEKELTASFTAMLARQNRFREDSFWSAESAGDMPLDNVDILIIDNELREFFGKTGVFTSADEVAYMARCFSTCKLIVVVNRTTSNPFDLTGNFSYLGQFEAFSDIEIGQTQLSSKALWGTGAAEFHPWTWFILPRWVDEFDKRVLDTESALLEKTSILSFFDLENVKEWLPRRITQTLGSGKDYSFEEFVRSSPFILSAKDRAVLRGKQIGEASIRNLAPIVAARLWKWLEVQLLPELDVLIDAPHLTTRFPSLLAGDQTDIDVWNAIAVRHDRDVPNLKMDSIERYRFSKFHWLTRPAWYWRGVMDEPDIPDVNEPWNIEYVPFVFCEDISRFAVEEQAKSYRASVDSPFGLRYIKKLDGVDYQPIQRLAL